MVSALHLSRRPAGVCADLQARGDELDPCPLHLVEDALQERGLGRGRSESTTRADPPPRAIQGPVVRWQCPTRPRGTLERSNDSIGAERRTLASRAGCAVLGAPEAVACLLGPRL